MPRAARAIAYISPERGEGAAATASAQFIAAHQASLNSRSIRHAAYSAAMMAASPRRHIVMPFVMTESVLSSACFQTYQPQSHVFYREASKENAAYAAR